MVPRLKEKRKGTLNMNTLFLSLALTMTIATQSARAADAPKPCQQIAQACKTAGFIKGDWKKGDGLWRDCVDPIMQGQTSVPGATKPLPTVDANLVAECKAKHPKFGTGKVGGTPKKTTAAPQK